MINVSVTFYQVKIYINDILHLKFYREEFIGFQSWIDGDKTKSYNIQYTFKTTTILCEYDSIERWKEILKKLDELL
jgi:hypothetical protein